MDPTVVEVRLDRGRFLFLLNNVATWGEVSFAVATLLEYIYPFPRRHKPDSVHGPLIDPLIFEKPMEIAAQRLSPPLTLVGKLSSHAAGSLLSLSLCVS